MMHFVTGLGVLALIVLAVSVAFAAACFYNRDNQKDVVANALYNYWSARFVILSFVALFIAVMCFVNPNAVISLLFH
jgi:hypothetical protein